MGLRMSGWFLIHHCTTWPLRNFVYRSRLSFIRPLSRSIVPPCSFAHRSRAVPTMAPLFVFILLHRPIYFCLQCYGRLFPNSLCRMARLAPSS